MKLTFLGTGTSMGVPVAGGFGREIPTGDSRDDRYRTSAWVQTDKTSIVIDTGPEFRLQTLRAGIRTIDLLLLTHEHNDHVAGLDDLRPYCYKQRDPITTYSTSDCKEALQKRFHYMFGPDKTPGSVNLDMSVLNDSTTFRDCKITALPVDHNVMPVNGYRINDLSYVTDAKYIPESTKQLIRGSKVLVLNGLQWEPKHKTHITIPEAVELATEMEIPKTYLVHISSYVIHKKIAARLPEHVELAYDQLSINV